MEVAAIPNGSSRHLRFGAWLAIAILLHALLMLLPLQRATPPPPPDAPRPLTVTFERAEPPPPVVRTGPEPPAAAAPGLAAMQPAVDGRADAPQAPSAPPAPAAMPRPSTASLLDFAARRGAGLSAPTSTLELGVFTPQAGPGEHGSRKVIDVGRPAGSRTAAATAVVDRWLAADGSHNVLVTTPSGETYCGRAEAWDPMEPLYEPVMMFRDCGSGGRPAFDLPEHRSGERRSANMAR